MQSQYLLYESIIIFHFIYWSINKIILITHLLSPLKDSSFAVVTCCCFLGRSIVRLCLIGAFDSWFECCNCFHCHVCAAVEVQTKNWKKKNTNGFPMAFARSGSWSFVHYFLCVSIQKPLKVELQWNSPYDSRYQPKIRILIATNLDFILYQLSIGNDDNYNYDDYCWYKNTKCII